MDSSNWTEAAGQAIQKPPACLKAFKVTPLDHQPEDRPSEWAGFALQCGQCGERHFQVLGFPLRAPDPSPYYGIKPGEVFFRPPHRLRCVSCGHTADLFDPRKDGYDGVLGHGSSYETGEEDESPATSANARFLISVTFGYSIELDELLEIAEENGISPSDLFDSLGIQGASVDGGPDLSLDYECA